MRWANVVNGEFLRLAETSRFDVLLTADSNIKQQQNLTGRSIAIVVLRAYSNRLAIHLEMLDMIRRTLGAIEPGEIIEVFHPDMANRRHSPTPIVDLRVVTARHHQQVVELQLKEFLRF